MKAVRDFGLNVLVLAVGFLIGILILEGCIRISDLFGLTGKHGEVALNSLGHTVYTPNLDKTVPAEQVGAAPVRIYANGDGYIGRDYPKAVPEGTKRVVALGDSFTAATGVNTDKNFVSLLEKDAALSGVEVMNFGVAGQGTVSELVRYSSTDSEWEHNLVVVFFYPNDFTENQYFLPYQEKFVAPFDWTSVPFSYVNSSLPITDIGQALFKASRALQFINAKIRGNIGLEYVAIKIGLYKADIIGIKDEDAFPRFSIYKIPLPDPHRQVFDFTEQVLTTLKQTAELNGSKLALVYVPAAIAVDGKLWEERKEKIPTLLDYEWDFNQPNVFLRNAAQRNSIEFLDLTPIFKNAYSENPDAEFYANRDWHLNEAGHALVAESVAPFLGEVLNTHR